MKYNMPVYALILVVLNILPLGCRGKAAPTDGPIQMMENAEVTSSPQIVGQMVEADEHGNAVTDIKPAQFTALGWDLEDTLEVEFETGQKIRCRYVMNYEDVPVGDYLVRFSESQGVLKIAINEGYLADALKLKSPSKVILRRVEVDRFDL
ncbi:MAG: SAM-dependent chlorinase/fluorinase [Candidatus Poribacteria bacterium]|nr:SAM-dependent chlorinase/fluorinase [Candidatus Poribacteria bacterium]